MQNDTLLAIPFFTFMGIILERSGMAEDLLETVGQVFGPLRGGLAIAVILVGALLAATTGVVAAAVIYGPDLPAHHAAPWLQPHGGHGGDRRLGHAGPGHPALLVLIVLADQPGRSVGDMYAGALIPGLLLVGLYILFVVIVALFKPAKLALLPEARIYREPSGRSGHRSLGVLVLICCGGLGLVTRAQRADDGLAGAQRASPGRDRSCP